MDMERRFAASAVVEGRQLVGLAAPFDSETRIADFRERIAPGAFARTLAERGDLGGVSMGFVATRDSWAGDLRTLHEVELFEVSIVQAHPAYSDTTVSLRSRSNAGLRADPRIRWLELYP